MARGGLLGIFDFIVLLRFPNLLCFARKFGKGLLLLCSLELAQCRLIGFTQIVTDVTSIGSTFLSCIALLGLLVLLGFTVTFALFVRMRWGVSPLRRRPRALPFGFPPPLKRWTKLLYGCAVTFALLPPRVLSLGSHFLGRV